MPPPPSSSHSPPSNTTYTASSPNRARATATAPPRPAGTILPLDSRVAECIRRRAWSGGWVGVRDLLEVAQGRGLRTDTDSSGKTLSNAEKYASWSRSRISAQSMLSATNEYGAEVNFDTCIDSGASSALLGRTGVGFSVGTVEEVDCTEWSGTVVS
ncbi:TPR-like protein [Teratosphaeria destructans]|uniref:TPR-like protein n=1 Tax=Teratosphaeria destructans TaxID=418781 RepID=A0A9W7T0L2_9PEZI|nr:TPR-like protein [Teratosphaeria destructans]